MRPDRPASVALIGYGSLMSGLGLAPLGRLRVRHAARVELRNARRGFAKHSQRGNRYAMALEPLSATAPIEARVLDAGHDAGENPEGLLLEVSTAEMQRIAAREGYDPGALSRLQRDAAMQHLPLAEFLWTQLAECGFDVAGYRARLFARTGYTSPHYVPHPVPLGETSYGVTFLAPGAEGSGSDRVVPIRVRTGNPPLMTAVQAWATRPNDSQIDYFTTCFLGALHGICQRDLIVGLDETNELYGQLRWALARERSAEQRRFLAATGLPPETYHVVFGEPSHLAQRSGLSRLFDSGSSGA